MKLTKEVGYVFTNDGYGGLSMLELDWGQDVIFERGDLNDGFNSIHDHFENRSYKWYESISDWFHEMDEFTEIE